MRHPKHILAQHGIEAKKSLGQNFLFDDGLLQKIVEMAELPSHAQVLEVGSGLGSLTAVLAEAAERLVCIELDNRFIPILQAQFGEMDHVELHHADILKVDPADLFSKPSQPYSVIANVPYYITGAILRHLLSASHKPQRIVLTVQKEVAERMTAPEGNLSLLAVSVRYYGTVRLMGNVAAGAFYPRPKVASSIVRIDVDQNVDPNNAWTDEPIFFRVAKAGFSQRRKQLKNNLRQLGISREQIEQALIASGVDGKRRAETLSIAEWRSLSGQLRSFM